jgi:DNA-binding MarR family transcriptional regulator/GNAT superfamily N-acetyltransferase
MDVGMVGQLRRFSRLVTQRLGILEDGYLARGRPLAASRVLWEIGRGGCDVRVLRARLEMDSGQLSRVLRSLEADGLVVTVPQPADRRVRTARLTEAGVAERAELDRRSDDLAASLISPLSEPQRARLAAAIGEVERLLTVSAVRVAPCDPADPRARAAVAAYAAELAGRFDTGFDPGRSLPVDDAALRPPAGVLLLATLHDTPVGCGSVKLHPGGTAELKRIWVAADTRGLGLGRRLLTDLETYAASHGARSVRLDTNGALTEAIALYRSAGYRDIPAYNTEPYADHWFEKALR